MGRPLVQSPKSHPGIPKDLDLANTPTQFKRHLRIVRILDRLTLPTSD